jgi:hypothetical protein
MPYLKGVLLGLVGAALAGLVALVAQIIMTLRVWNDSDGSSGIAGSYFSFGEGPVVIAAAIGFVAGFLRVVRRPRPRAGLRA